MKRICHLFSHKNKDPFSTGPYIQKETHQPSLKESRGVFSQVELLFFACFEWEDAKKLLTSDADSPPETDLIRSRLDDFQNGTPKRGNFHIHHILDFIPYTTPP